MTDADNWIDVGAAQDLSQAPLRRLTAKNAAVALSFADGKFGAVSDVCNHVGGPLGDGHSTRHPVCDDYQGELMVLVEVGPG